MSFDWWIEATFVQAGLLSRGSDLVLFFMHLVFHWFRFLLWFFFYWIVLPLGHRWLASFSLLLLPIFSTFLSNICKAGLVVGKSFSYVCFESILLHFLIQIRALLNNLFWVDSFVLESEIRIYHPTLLNSKSSPLIKNKPDWSPIMLSDHSCVLVSISFSKGSMIMICWGQDHGWLNLFGFLSLLVSGFPLHSKCLGSFLL